MLGPRRRITTRRLSESRAVPRARGEGTRAARPSRLGRRRAAAAKPPSLQQSPHIRAAHKPWPTSLSARREPCRARCSVPRLTAPLPEESSRACGELWPCSSRRRLRNLAGLRKAHDALLAACCSSSLQAQSRRLVREILPPSRQRARCRRDIRPASCTLPRTIIQTLLLRRQTSQ